ARIKAMKIGEVLERVARTERTLGIATGREADYLHVRGLLIRKDYYRALLLGRAPEAHSLLGSLGRPSLAGFGHRVRARLRADVYRARASAQVIRVKNNTRAFYFDTPRPFTVKMVISRSRGLEQLAREVAVRKH